MVWAMKSGDANTTKILIGCNQNVCVADYWYFQIPLIKGAVYGSVESVRDSLERGHDLEYRGIFMITALHYAAWHGHLDVCRLLLDLGAKVDPVDICRGTPLHDAAQQGRLSVVKLLVERGADVRLKNHFGQTASDVACSARNRDVAEWLESVRER